MSQPATTYVAGFARNAVRPWRVIGALTLLALVGAFGNAWDLFWHITIGRDSFWIPPHTMMYAAVALSGLIALAVVLGATLRRADRLSAMLGFRAPLGFFILGLGVLQMLISAPFDDWWDCVYGVDVSVDCVHTGGTGGRIVAKRGGEEHQMMPSLPIIFFSCRCFKVRRRTTAHCTILATPWLE
jgi:hypothetical protein